MEKNKNLNKITILSRAKIKKNCLYLMEIIFVWLTSRYYENVIIYYIFKYMFFIMARRQKNIINSIRSYITIFSCLTYDLLNKTFFVMFIF